MGQKVHFCCFHNFIPFGTRQNQWSKGWVTLQGRVCCQTPTGAAPLQSLCPSPTARVREPNLGWTGLCFSPGSDISKSSLHHWHRGKDKEDAPRGGGLRRGLQVMLASHTQLVLNDGRHWSQQQKGGEEPER